MKQALVACQLLGTCQYFGKSRLGNQNGFEPIFRKINQERSNLETHEAAIEQRLEVLKADLLVAINEIDLARYIDLQGRKHDGL